MEKTKKRSPVYLKLIYLIFFLLVYVVAVYRMLPYDKIKEYLRVKISQATACDVKIAKMDFSIINGIKLSGVSLKRDVKGVRVSVISFDELMIKPSYSSLLTDTINIGIDSKLYSGTVKGSIVLLRKARIVLGNLRLRLSSIDISKHQAVEQLYQVNTYGRLNGEVNLTGLQNGLSRSNGIIGLLLTDGGINGIALNQLSLGGGLFNFDDMELPDITFREIKVELKKDQKIVRVKSIKVDGDDINILVTGNVNVSEKIELSSGTLNIKLSALPKYLEKDETLSLFDESFKSYKNNEGFYSFKVEGTYVNPRVKML